VPSQCSPPPSELRYSIDDENRGPSTLYSNPPPHPYIRNHLQAQTKIFAYNGKSVGRNFRRRAWYFDRRRSRQLESCSSVSQFPVLNETNQTNSRDLRRNGTVEGRDALTYELTSNPASSINYSSNRSRICFSRNVSARWQAPGRKSPTTTTARSLVIQFRHNSGSSRR